MNITEMFGTPTLQATFANRITVSADPLQFELIFGEETSITPLRRNAVIVIHSTVAKVLRDELTKCIDVYEKNFGVIISGPPSDLALGLFKQQGESDDDSTE